MNTRWRERERNRKGERQERDEEAAGESEEGMVGERGPQEKAREVSRTVSSNGRSKRSIG